MHASTPPAPADALPGAATAEREAGPLELEPVTTPAGLAALRTEWADLWARDPRATPFQSPDWLLAWLHHLGRGRPLALALRRAGRLVALAPLFLSDDDDDGATPTRRVLLLGAGVSDYLDLLAEPADAAAAAATTLAWLAAHAREWDACTLEPLPAGSPLLHAAPPPGLDTRAAPAAPCPVLRLPPPPATLADCLPAGLLRRLAYYRRRAARSASVRIERADATTLDELLEAFFRLHAARWAARGLPGVLDDERVRRFHREAAPGLLAQGTLRLYALRLDDAPAATLYTLRHRGRVLLYLGGFDPAAARLNPGTLLLGHAVEEALREGATEVDFLRGAEPYKYAWGARDRPVWRLELATPHRPRPEGAP